MDRWEYRLIDSKDVERAGLLKGRSREALEEYLNTLGLEGWEVVSLDYRESEGSRWNFNGVAKRRR